MKKSLQPLKQEFGHVARFSSLKSAKDATAALFYERYPNCSLQQWDVFWSLWDAQTETIRLEKDPQDLIKEIVEDIKSQGGTKAICQQRETEAKAAQEKKAQLQRAIDTPREGIEGEFLLDQKNSIAVREKIKSANSIEDLQEIMRDKREMTEALIRSLKPRYNEKQKKAVWRVWERYADQSPEIILEHPVNVVARMIFSTIEENESLFPPSKSSTGRLKNKPAAAAPLISPP